MTGEKPVDVSSGQTFETPVAGDTEVLLRDVARITVSAGAAAGALKDAADKAQEELDRLLRDVGYLRR